MTYFFVWILLAIIAFYLADSNLIRMYEGMTQKVDAIQLIDRASFIYNKENLRIICRGTRFLANSDVTIEYRHMTCVDSVLINPHGVQEIGRR